jgi:hypothetical protein
MMKKNKQCNQVEFDADEYRHKLLAELSGRISEPNAISMTALFEAVYERPWFDKVNDTRDIRKLVALMHHEGVPICSTSSKNGGGYYLAAAGWELANFLKKRKLQALVKLQDNAKIMKISLPNYLGQIKLEMEGTYSEQDQKSLF